MRNDGHAELQHSVPQLLLRFHTNNHGAKKGSEQVWCFDKLTDNIFSPNIRGILAGSRFYEIEVNGRIISLEASLGEIENQVGPIIGRLVKTRTLADLSVDERRSLASFCSVQFVRTQGFREQIKGVNEGIAKALQERGIVPSDISNFKMLSEEELKRLSLHMLLDAPQTYGPHFLDKHWYLIESKVDDPFHLGDHPVVVDRDFVGGTVGLALPGASAYLPLCPTLCLGMSDASLVSQLFEDARTINLNYEQFERKRPLPGFVTEAAAALVEMKKNRDAVNESVRPLKMGTPTAYDQRVTSRVNSLQMLYASRWVISSRRDFSLPERMIADNEKFRRGPDFRVT